ncbi:MAG: 16S rRNA (cytosine(967)-C(5))-methyltransferase RsmB [Bacteroidota bacterium]
MKLSSLLGHTRELLQLIHTSGNPADSLIDSFFRSHKYLGSHDRRFIAETVYGTLRHLRRCDVVLQRVVGGQRQGVPPEDGFLLLLVTYLLLVERRTVLSSGDLLPQLKSSRLKAILDDLLTKIPSQATDEEQEAAERIGIRYSYPRWMVERFFSQYGEEETERLCASLNEQASLTLRVNTLKTTVDGCQKLLKAEGVETKRTQLSPFGLEVPKRINIFQLQSFRDGMFEVQDEGSQLLPLLVDPKPTAKVLDACAGAGGKTLEFAALMNNRGEIVATDVQKFRLEQLRKRLRRAGVSNVRIKEVKDLSTLSQQSSAYFDLVFVDAPCSGLGTIRRNPGMKWTVTEESVRELSSKQLNILNTSAPLVKPGGKLVYATCTLLREENEDVVEAFLVQQKEYAVSDPLSYLSNFNLEKLASTRYTKLLPHRDGTDGFFCAVLERARM